MSPIEVIATGHNSLGRQEQRRLTGLAALRILTSHLIACDDIGNDRLIELKHRATIVHRDRRDLRGVLVDLRQIGLHLKQLTIHLITQLLLGITSHSLVVDIACVELSASRSKVHADRSRCHRVESNTHLIVLLERLIVCVRVSLRRRRSTGLGLTGSTLALLVGDLSVDTDRHIKDLKIEAVRVIQDNRHVLGVVAKRHVTSRDRLTLQRVLMELAIGARQEHLVVIRVRGKTCLVTSIEKHHCASLRRIRVHTHHTTGCLRARGRKRLRIHRRRTELLLGIRIRRHTCASQQCRSS